MLRAMCEAAANPHHSDGLLGDAINLVLSAGHALVGGEEELGEYREYTQAQTEGQVRLPPSSLIVTVSGLRRLLDLQSVLPNLIL